MGLGLLMKPRQRRNTAEKMVNTKSLQLARFSPISKQRQIYNTFFSVSVSLFILTKRKTTSIQTKSSCIPCEMNWCALIKKNEDEKKASLGCLFNLISVHRSAIFSAGWFFSLSRFALSFRLLFFSLNWLTICNARHLRICS